MALSTPADPNQPQRAPWGLLDLALPAPEGWQRGLVIPWYGCGEPILRNKCVTGEDEAHRPNVVDYPPFPIEQGSTCSTLSRLDHEAFARARFDATAEWAMGRQLATDQAETGAPSLVDASVSGTYDDVVDAIACLEQCAADSGYGAAWVLHTSVRGAAYLRRYKMLDSNGLSPSGAQWIISPGYPANGGTDDTVRFWATGPVWAAAGDVEINSAVDWRQNEDTAYALGMGIVAFDPCILCAVDVTVGACLPPEPPSPVITGPEDGATVNPLSPFVGRGCGPNEEVQLWVNEDAVNNPGGAGRQVDTTTTNENGAFTFVGTTPIHAGTHEFWVVCGGQESDHITVTVEDDTPTETLSFDWELRARIAGSAPPSPNFGLYVLDGSGTYPAGEWTANRVSGYVDSGPVPMRSSEAVPVGSDQLIMAEQAVTGTETAVLAVSGPWGIEFSPSGDVPPDLTTDYVAIDSGTVTYTRPVTN